MGSWECPIVWGFSASRARCVKAQGASHSMRGSALLYGLMECPIVWEVSARECVVYGLMECPIVWRVSSTERVVSRLKERPITWGVSAKERVEAWELMECPIIEEQLVRRNAWCMYGLMECPIMSVRKHATTGNTQPTLEEGEIKRQAQRHRFIFWKDGAVTTIAVYFKTPERTFPKNKSSWPPGSRSSVARTALLSMRSARLCNAGGGGILPYISYIGTFRQSGYHFQGLLS